MHHAFLQVSVKLRAYEETVQEAAEAGLLVSFVIDTVDQDDRGELDLPPIVTERWSILQAVFFASTVLTTIGNQLYNHLRYLASAYQQII